MEIKHFYSEAWVRLGVRMPELGEFDDYFNLRDE